VVHALPAFTAAWTPAVLPFLVGAVVCIAAVPLTMALAHRIGAVADASRERDVHDHPTPRFGGLAMMAGFAVAMALFGSSVEHRWEVVAIAAAISVAMAVDDALDLSPRSKLLLDLGSGIAVALVGITIDFIAFPGGHVLNFGILAAPITIAWVMGMENSINLIDGVDGVAAGVCAIVAGVLLLAAVNRLEPGDGVQQGVIVMAGALMGVCVGFLFWNFHPAHTFMGDSGSRFLGLTLAVTLLALGLPIADTVWAIYRRKRHGLRITQADSSHLHHRMLDYGLSIRETAIAFWLATAVLGCIALALFGHQHTLIVAAVLLFASLLALLWRNRRRLLSEAQHDYLMLEGRAAVPSHARHSGEVD
jgi:UDP-GlcNAc:undecaprenyl-phosphate GlcNAc-1-phosphate transferase